MKDKTKLAKQPEKTKIASYSRRRLNLSFSKLRELI